MFLDGGAECDRGVLFLQLFHITLQVDCDQLFEEVRVLAKSAGVPALKDVALQGHLAEPDCELDRDETLR